MIARLSSACAYGTPNVVNILSLTQASPIVFGGTILPSTYQQFRLLDAATTTITDTTNLITYIKEAQMRMLLHVKFPHEAFNAAVKDATAGKKIQRILDELKPEAAYFTEYQGRRGAIVIINLDDPSKVPTFAEPWFLLFNADCEFHVVMTPEDLAKADLDDLGQKWS